MCVLASQNIHTYPPRRLYLIKVSGFMYQACLHLFFTWNRVQEIPPEMHSMLKTHKLLHKEKQVLLEIVYFSTLKLTDLVHFGIKQIV